MNPPMTWDRVYRIISYLRLHGLPKTPGHLKYLINEVDRMDRYQRTWFNTECSGILSRRWC